MHGLLLLVAMATAGLDGVQKPKRAPDAIRAEIAQLRERLKDLETELSQAEGLNLEPLSVGSMKIGAVGYFSDGANSIGIPGRALLRVIKPIDKNMTLAEVMFSSPRVRKGAAQPSVIALPRVVIRGVPTDNLVTGSILEEPTNWRVVGKQEYKDSTYFVVEPYTTPPPKK